jgi:predicted cupin superfamily sugar epimerase
METDSQLTPEAAALVERLALQPHPEGGFYRETYVADTTLETPNGTRPSATSIYYLLAGTAFSAFHRLRSDELWYFHGGCGLTVHVIAPDGAYRRQELEADRPQVLIPREHWFGAELRVPGSFCLVSCVVTPGFHFDDFELAGRSQLVSQFPAYTEVIGRLTRVGDGA